MIGLTGLTTKAALSKLEQELFETISKYKRKIDEESIFLKTKSAFAKRYESPLGFFSILTTIATILGLIVIEDYFPALIIFLVLLINLIIVIRESDLRRTEIIRKSLKIVEEIKLAKELCSDWNMSNYPHLCSPVSPCVSLQWTYRDGVIINLPYALLVKGDYIILRPGHTVPGKCIEIDKKREFKANEVYGVSNLMEPPTKPTAISPMPNLICVLENTPVLDNLRIIIENSLKRPPTIYNQQRYLLVTKYIQQWGFVSSLCLTVIVGTFRFYGFGIENDSKFSKEQSWKHVFFEGPISAAIPLLPLFFPLLWISINLWGIARLDTFLHQPPHLLKRKIEKSFEEDLDTPTYYDNEDVPLNKIKVFRSWLALWRGSSDLLCRSANVVQVLGSVTALCCVDKKGILSWPNPTAEKVFFLHDSDKTSIVSETSLESEHTINNPNPNKKSGIIAEVLDLTHDQNCPFKLDFDDHRWKNYINSLKPLGLAILLNTCNQETFMQYMQFCGHVSSVAMCDKNLVPVTNRYEIIESSLNSFLHGRCLCELATQIGFVQNATNHFSLEGQLASYRHLQPDVVRRDIRFARQLQLSSKVKVPFPHCLSVILREAPQNTLLLFTQGTADIVLDCCDDFWDGKDLRSLGPQDRKRAQDFYQRNALTAYCTAFAYRPLRQGVSIGALSCSENNEDNIAYLEFPPESKYKHFDKVHCEYESHNMAKLSHSISTDSLLFSEAKEEECCADSVFQTQSHQVFIGMITMQYQAQTDIVQLVERLEKACIRLVHFSKENELRSRVFSEKMGLESGWNCHISLSEENSNQQSPKASKDDENILLVQPMPLESSKTLSSSAPGAISNQDCNLNMMCSRENSNESFGDFEVIERPSEDSALDENCRSLSISLSLSEQSAPITFDMSNRAKLPRGIKNIRPHLEQVDNVPLQVSLFTDCSAEATREMLSIMQSYGEIVVCLGSSASNSNAEIFLQADCSIAVEPLYTQVCQNIAAYTEANILNNRFKLPKEKFLNDDYFDDEIMLNTKTMYIRNNTISPIYLSRILNALPCSISVLRDDPLSIVSIIDLSRRFSLGLWNCIQFWACCSVALALINLIVCCLSLPPMFTPISLCYLMFLSMLISISLTNIETDPKVMNRATGKKQTKFNTKVFGFVVWCYGCKFFSLIIILILSYCTLMAHPLEILDVDEANYELNLNLTRIYTLFGIVLHFVITSISFVHRDHSIWRKNPFSNRIWTWCCSIILIFHLFFFIIQVIVTEDVLYELDETWPVILFILSSSLISFFITEICKYQEIKVNQRYQRRARLDFGTKLGMNSPF